MKNADSNREMQDLPLGINTLEPIRSYNMAYVDKTQIAWKLARRMGRFFLSRPRRFGKSLFLDTLKEIFEGKQTLFKGLFIEKKWDWTLSYPVIKIDFSGGNLKTAQALEQRILNILGVNQDAHAIHCKPDQDVAGYFGEMIRKLHEKNGLRVVILIDEYDKPILDNIEDPETAGKMRDALRNFYSVMKSEDAHIQFVFMTGVSKFSKVSLFSGINHLKDITLDPQYATICGYTQNDLETTFYKHLDGVDWKKFKRWYNGYQWLGEPVYNPYDVLLFIDSQRLYRNYWFETGSPSFLMKLFQKKRYFLPNLESIEVGEEVLDSFDIESIRPETLLFQSGYLTIKEMVTHREEIHFVLKIPNFEVCLALNNAFINTYTQLDTEKYKFKNAIYDALMVGDLLAMQQEIESLFAGIPWRNFTQNDLLTSEGYFASVLYAFFASLNAQIIPEDISNHGQADLTVILEKRIYVMEIKVVGRNKRDKAALPLPTPSIEDKHKTGKKNMLEIENKALEQISKKKYSKKYRNKPGFTLYEVGMIFSKPHRNLVQFDWKKI